MPQRSLSTAPPSTTHYAGVQHLIYASSSSVYGGNKKVPFSTDDNVDHPISLYAATKKSNELFAHCYSKLYDIPTTGLRFFTVYGPAGRPDMAYFGFTNKLLKGDTIQIYNYGNCCRDFTYVDDIVEGIVRVMGKAPERMTGDDGLPVPPYKVYKIPAEGFIVNQLASRRFSIKPNLYGHKFLFRGQSKYYDKCYPNLFRDEKKTNFLDDLIWSQEL